MTDDPTVTASDADETATNSFSELSEILAEEDIDNDEERDQPSNEEVANRDMSELREEYGPFVDLDIKQE